MEKATKIHFSITLPFGQLEGVNKKKQLKDMKFFKLELSSNPSQIFFKTTNFY